MLDPKTAYVSRIPPKAQARVLRCGPDGEPRFISYQTREGICGYRRYTRGVLTEEESWHRNMRHGPTFLFDVSGALTAYEPYENDLPHGMAYQWAAGTGALLGTYELRHGNGITLRWWPEPEAEGRLWQALEIEEGWTQGYYWKFHFRSAALHMEMSLCKGVPHGIQREWNEDSAFGPMGMRFWAHGKLVTQSEYMKLAKGDPSLPPYRVEEDDPAREFPPEVREALLPRPNASPLS